MSSTVKYSTVQHKKNCGIIDCLVCKHDGGECEKKNIVWAMSYPVRSVVDYYIQTSVIKVRHPPILTSGARSILNCTTSRA